MRSTMKLALFAAMISASPALAAAPAENPYALLREGYAAADGARAAAAYTPDAAYAELYEAASPRLITGRESIAALFSELFSALGERPDLNFRLIKSEVLNGVVTDIGVYRMRTAEAANYGRFMTRRSAGGLFNTDASSAAVVGDFESIAGPVMFANDDEALDPDYYDALIGDYASENGATMRITRSNWRLFALDGEGRWRGLARVAGMDWRGGAHVIDDKGETPFVFSTSGGALVDIDGKRYSRAPSATVEHVSFKSGDLVLAGDLYLPGGAGGRRPAVVLIHGSGPQDRHGYASIIELMARRFADAGIAALSFDKRGVGGSEGSWESAGFEALASDVRAARAYLATRDDINAARIGYAGSSQAGWVAASAIADGDDPAFVILVGAAGAAMTVAEQNLYNTEVRMKCAGLLADSVELALAQQRAFFAAKRDRALAPQLSDATRAAQADASISDWLFPGSAEPAEALQWYDVLDPDFDPLPVWTKYSGRTFFLFGSLDDSTPTGIALERLRTLPGERQAKSLDGAQHLGLAAKSLCDGELGDVATFHPEFWPTFDQWARSAVARR